MSGATATARLEVRRLLQIFGRDTRAAHALVQQGLGSDEVRNRTGCTVAVRDVDLAVAPGEIFVLMGLSGSGKSTLLRCLNQLIVPTAGEVRLDGEDMLAYTSAERREARRRRMAMVFQNFALLGHLDVLSNVEFGLAIRGEPLATRRAKAMETLGLVGLERWAHQYPDELSGGMRQRVGLARALATDADVLLMDEPFSALDPLIRRNLQDELLRLQARLKKTIVFVTHDFAEAVRLGDRVAVMRGGEVVQVGSPRELLLMPVDAYVADFTRDIDVAQALRAGDLAPVRADREAARALLAASGGAQLDEVEIDPDMPLRELYPLLARGGRARLRGMTFDAGTLDAGDLVHCLGSRRASPARSRTRATSCRSRPPAGSWCSCAARTASCAASTTSAGTAARASCTSRATAR